MIIKMLKMSMRKRNC
ncbi:TPA: hypothetical protein ACN6ZP_001716 [Escherichia albertii]